MRLQYGARIRQLMTIRPAQGHSPSHDGNWGWLVLWQTAGAALLGIVLARWFWLLLSPAGAALPTASGNNPGEASQLFGLTNTNDAQALSPVSNIQLIGVFARQTNGFAIMLVDGKQVGVAQGEEVRPGLRLAETHSNYVLLDQGGESLRVDLHAPAAPAANAGPESSGNVSPGPTGNISPDSTGTASAQAAGGSSLPPPQTTLSTPPPSSGPSPDVLQQQLDASPNMPPAQRQRLERQIEIMRKQAR